MAARSRTRLTLLALVALVALAALPALVATARIAADPLHFAVEQVRLRGAYGYDARIQTTTTPMPRLENVGLTPTQQELALRGQVDLRAATLDLQLLGGSGGFGTRAGVVDIQVADGVARGRVGAGQWEAMELPGGAFGPGGDFLGLLSAARGVSAPEPVQLGGLELTRYRFTIDGPAFAQQMRAQQERTLREQGRLPASVSLGLIDAYLDTTGSGELLLDADGLPRRQLITLSVPDEARGETVSGTITIDYAGYPAALPLARPLQWALAADWAALLLNLAAVAAAAAMALALVRARRSRGAYAALAVFTVLVTLASPLLNAEGMRALAAPAEEPPAAPAAATAPAPASSAPAAAPLAAARQLAAGADADRDGLTDAAEAELRTSPSLADTDDDGLTDGVEVLEIGTSPLQADSDGDTFNDRLELDPLVGPDGRIWRLDPFKLDTNDDGVSDFLDCAGATYCPDTDGDQTPDAWDDDNDDDGVPDRLDSSPRQVVSGGRGAAGLLGVPGGSLRVSAANAAPGRTLLFDFTVRPTNPGRLWYSSSILDWPSDDREGQIRRVSDTPFGTSGNLANGDMRVEPMLELRIPYVAGSFGGLPVKADYTGTDMPSLAGVNLNNSDEIKRWFDQWLDQSRLRASQISVRLAGADRSLLAYVPLDVQRDPVGDMPVAFTARMLFRPRTGSVPAYTTRLSWTVQVKGDSCKAHPAATDPKGETFNKGWWEALPADQRRGQKYTEWKELGDGERANRWCESTANWQTDDPNVVHTYYDDFYLAALDLREDRGMEIAVAAQRPEAGSTAFQPHVWSLARGLERAFVGGRDCDTLSAGVCQGNGALDLTPATIAARWNSGSNAGVSDVQRWNIPAGALSVQRYSFVDEGESAGLFFSTPGANGETPPKLLDFLNKTFVVNGASRTALPTVLVARMHTTTDASLSTGSTISTGSVAFDLSTAPTTTRAGISWQPFRLQPQGTWEVAPIDAAWQQLGAAFNAPLQAYGGAPARDAFTLAGATDLLKHYYLTLNSGRSGMLAIDSVAVNRGVSANADVNLQAPTVPERVLGLVAEEFASSVVTAQSHRALLFKADSAGLLAAVGGQRLTQDGGPALGLLVDVARLKPEGNSSLYAGAMAALAVSIKLPTPDPKELLIVISKSMDTSTGVQGAIDALKSIYDDVSFSELKTAVKTLSKNLSTTIKNLKLPRTVAAAKEMFKSLAQNTPDLAKTLDSALDAVKKGGKVALVVAVVVELVVFAAKLIEMIASGDVDVIAVIGLIVTTLVSAFINIVVLGAIAAVVPIGTLLAAILAVIDLVIAVVCWAINAEGFICDGIVGNVVKVVTAIFWDANPLVDMEAKDRLTPTNWTVTPRDPVTGANTGLVAGNIVTLGADVVTKLSVSTYAVLRSNVFGLLFDLDSDGLVRSTFRYEFTTQSEEDDQQIHERRNLSLNQMRSSWRRIDRTGFDQQVVTQTITTSLTLDRAGLNWHPNGLYLAEGYAAPAVLCVTSVCAPYTKDGSTYLNLAPSFAFDVFPKTIDGLFSLADSDGDGGFRLSWDSSFPDLKDADGDGLRARPAGGNDPNDNSPDSDRDGLTDFYELDHAHQGLSPSRADTDGDGLTDHQEIRLGLPPAAADSDNDGLSDGAELAGWEIVYGYDAGDKPLLFRTGSDPRDPDTDNDGLLDNREQIYGLNPRVASSGEPLQIQSQLIEPDAVADGIVAPNANVGFSAVITNTLRDRFALGLFEADLESTALKPDLAPSAYRLGPLGNATLGGSLNLAGQTSTVKTATLIRAGAIIADLEQISGGRVLWLPFEEASSTSGYADLSPFGHNATCSGAACPDPEQAGYSGRGARFVSGDKLTVAHTNALSPARFTLSLWVRPSSSESYQGLIQKEDAPNTRVGYHLGIPPSSKQVRFFAHGANCTTSGIDVSSSIDLTMGAWNLVTAVYDGAQVRLYINGRAAGAWNHSGGLCAAGGPITLTGPVGGLVDDLALYPVPMTAAEVQAQFRDPVVQLAFNSDASDTSNLRQQTALKGAGGITFANSRDGDRVAVFDKRRWVDIAPSSSLDMAQGTGQFTLSAYVRPVPLEPDSGWQGIMGREEGFDSYPSLYVNRDGQLRVAFGTGSAFCDSGGTTSRIAAGLWSHVTVSYTGSQFVFYLNGSEIERRSLSGACASNSRPKGSSFSIGRVSPAATFSITEIKVHDEGDDSGYAEYEAFWDGASKWTNNSIDVGTYKPNELSSLPFSQDRGYRFELKEIDTCDSCHDIQIDLSLQNYQVNSGSSWNYNDDGSGAVSWRLWNSWFNGDLDEVRVYRVALDAADARDLYTGLNNRAYALRTRLEEPPTASLFRDGSGNLLTGYCSGTTCPTTGLPGRDGQAARFDGNDAVVIADRPSLDLANGVTASAWVRLDDPSADQKIVSKYDLALGGYILGVQNGQVYAEVKDAAGNHTQVRGGTIPAGVWTHVAMSASPGQFVVGFVNGVEVGRSALPQTQRAGVAYGHPIPGTVTLYGDSSYESSGHNMVWSATSDVASFYGGVFTDDRNEASSIRTGGACVRLYDNANYGGTPSQPVCDDTPNLRSFNDRAESMRYYKTPPSFSSTEGALSLSRDSLQYVSIEPNKVGNPLFSTISVAAWVKVPSFGEWHTIAARGDNGMPEGFSFRITGDRKLRLQAGNGGWESTGTVAGGTWTHVAVTLDGATVRFYLNGVESGSYGFTGNINDVSGPLLIGRMPKCGQVPFCDFFDGSMRGLAIFTRAISGAEVARLKDSPSGAAPNGRVVYLPFDENQGTAWWTGPTLFRTLVASPLGVNDLPLTIGRASWENSLFVRGAIDEVAVLEYAADQAAVAAMMGEAPALRLALDEPLNSGTSFADTASTTTAGCVACPRLGARGRVREAPVFGATGSAAAISVPDAPRLDLSRFSLELWVRPEAIRPGEQIILAKAAAAGASNNYTLSLAPGTLKPRLTTAGGSVTAQGSLNQSQWNHIVGTYDGSQLRLFINGFADSAVSASNPVLNTEPLSIGSHSSYGVAFNGMLDELAIYRGALSPEEVAAHYRYQESWFDVVERHELIVDGDKPTAALSLTDGTVVPNAPLALSIAASDPTSAVTGVWYDADGNATAGPWLAAQRGTDGEGWFFTFTPPGTGSFPLRAYAVDRYGNQSPVIASTVRVDGAAPTLSVSPGLGAAALRPTPGTGVNAGAWLLNLSGSVADNFPGAVTVAASVVGPEGDLGALVLPNVSGSWSGTYRFTAPPNGRYTLKVRATDESGNSVAAPPVVLTLDATAPTADVAIGGTAIGNQQPAQASVARVALRPSLQGVVASTALPPVLRGTIADVPGLPDTLLAAHFEEAAGAVAFLDGSLFQGRGTCAGTACPTAGIAGQSGSGLSFDAADDQVAFGLPPVPANGPFTVSVWAKPGDSTPRALLSAADAAGQSLELLVTRDLLTVSARVGGVLRQVGAGTLVPDAWSHIAVSFDGATFTTFVNGAVSERSAAGGSVAGFDRGWLGSRAGGAPFYAGLADELTLYASPVAESTVAWLAGAVRSPISTPSPRLVHLKDRESGAATALNATLTPVAGAALWSAPVPQGLEGIYLLNMGTADTLGNARVLDGIWSGTIDTLAPRAAMFYRDMGDGRVQVSCQIADFNLDPALITCPVPRDQWTYGDMAEPWYTSFFTGAPRKVTMSTPPVIFSEPVSNLLRACDSFGNCAEVAGSTTGGLLGGMSTIDAPSNGLIITSPGPVTVSGYATAQAGLQSLAVTANGVSILARSYGSETQDAWTTSFTPPSEGVYRLQATARNDAGAVFTDAVAPTITVDLTPPSLRLDGDFVSGAVLPAPDRLPVSGAVTETVGLTALRARLDGGPWQALAILAGIPGTAALAFTLSGAAPFNDGQQVLVELEATDLAGRTVSTTRTLTIDLTAPALALPVALLDESDVAGAQLRIPAVITKTVNITRLEGRLDSGAWADLPLPASDEGPVAFALELNAGRTVADGDRFLVTMRATSRTGQVLTVSRTVTADLLAPDLRLDGAFVTGPQLPAANRLPVSGAVTETAGLASLRARLDGGPWQMQVIPAGIPGAAPFGLELTSAAPFTDGQQVLVALEATDLAGRTASTTRTLTVDLAAPELALPVTLLDQTKVSGAELRVPATVTETVGLSTLEVRLDGGAWTPVSLPALVDGAASPTLALDTGAPVADGARFVVGLRATDRAGQATTITRAVTVDLVGPGLRLDGAFVTGPQLPAADRLPVSGAVTETAGLTSLRARLDGGPWQALAIPAGIPGTGALAFTLSGASPFTDGQQVLVELEATDLAGRTASTTRTLTVDLAAPELTLPLEVLDDTKVSGSTLSVPAEVREAVGLSTLEARLDNGAWTPVALPALVDGAASLTLALDTGAPVADGARFVVGLRATDRAGQATTITRAVTADLVGPGLRLDGAFVTGPQLPAADRLPVSGAVTETAGLTSLRARLDGGPWQVLAIPAGIPGAAPLSLELPNAAPFTDGQQVLVELEATDLAGRTASTTRTLTIDLAGPELTLPLEVLDDTKVSGSTLSVPAEVREAVGLSTLEARLDNGAWTPVALPALVDGAASLTLALDTGAPVADGARFVVGLRATDRAGQVTTITRAVTADLLAPSVRLDGTILGDAQLPAADILPVSGAVTETVGLAALRARLDGGPWQMQVIPVGIPGAAPLSLELASAAPFTDGQQVLVELEATDLAGRTVSTTRTLTVDLAGPELTLPLAVLDDTKVSGSTLSVPAEVREAVGLSTLEARLDNGAWTPVPLSALAGGTASLTLALDTGSPVADGARFVVGLRATDRVGHVATIVRTVTVDLLAPAVRLDGAVVGSAQLSAPDVLPVSGAVTETVGLASLRARLDNGLWQELAIPAGVPGSAPLSLELRGAAAFLDGQQVFVELEATDGAGRSVRATRTIAVDLEAPALALPRGLLDETAVTGAELRVPAEVREAVGLSTLEARLDGGTWAPIAPPTLTGGAASVTLALDTGAPVADGARFVVGLRATDRVGQATAITRTVTVDLLAPALTLPAAGEPGAPAATGGTLSFSVGVAETVSLAQVEARIGGGAWLPLDTSALVGGSGQIVASLNLSALGVLDGQQVELEIRAVDGVGHITTLARSLTLDTTAPRVSADEVVVEGARRGISVRGAVRDGGGTPTLRLVVEQEDGSVREHPVSLTPGDAGAWSWEITTVYREGQLSDRLWVVAVDPAGNESRVLVQGAREVHRVMLPLIGNQMPGGAGQ